jgi:hypothetical protein
MGKLTRTTSVRRCLQSNVTSTSTFALRAAASTWRSFPPCIAPTVPLLPRWPVHLFRSPLLPARSETAEAPAFLSWHEYSFRLLKYGLAHHQHTQKRLCQRDNRRGTSRFGTGGRHPASRVEKDPLHRPRSPCTFSDSSGDKRSTSKKPSISA